METTYEVWIKFNCGEESSFFTAVSYEGFSDCWDKIDRVSDQIRERNPGSTLFTEIKYTKSTTHYDY
jgi:hypothetical protein